MASKARRARNDRPSKPNVGAKASINDSRTPSILKAKTVEVMKPHGKNPQGATLVKRLQSGTVEVNARKLQQLQDEIKLLRVTVAQHTHAIRVLQEERGLSSLALHRHRSSPSETPLGTGNLRAAHALADVQGRLDAARGADDEQATDLEEGSERIKRGWIRDGLLVGSVAFGLSWSRSRQALEQACGRGELFSLKIGNRRWYPSNLMGLPAEDVKAVCLLLRGVDPVSQFILWERKHGSLAGRTLHNALRIGQREAVLRTVEAFACEHAGRASVGQGPVGLGP